MSAVPVIQLKPCPNVGCKRQMLITSRQCKKCVLLLRRLNTPCPRVQIHNDKCDDRCNAHPCEYNHNLRYCDNCAKNIIPVNEYICRSCIRERTKPCPVYFSNLASPYCDNKDCKSENHDLSNYARYNRLRICRNYDECGQLYKEMEFAFCTACALKQKERGAREPRQEQQCKGYNCQAWTFGKFCKACAEVNATYVI